MGILPGTVEQTLTAGFNDLEDVRQLFEKHGADIAAIIVEPIAGNMGFILPEPGFLQGLRELCDHYHSLLIFDEVMTGFRVALGGAESLYQVSPDLTTLGKVIGGGLPVGAVGGRRDIMSLLAPLGGVYQAGTLSGNPLAMAAGLATLEEIKKPGFYQGLSNTSAALIQSLSDVCVDLKIPFVGASRGGMFGFCFSDQPSMRNYADVAGSDEALFKAFFHGMLQEGIYFAPSLYEAGFMSSAHGLAEIQATQAAAARVLERILITQRQD